VGWNDAASEAGSRKVVRHVLATESSVPTWRRIAAYDTNLAGGLIPAGTEILLELSGNHITSPAGPESLPAPAAPAQRVRDGQPTGHGLVFGSGIHRCLGAKLAELEATVTVQETAAAHPRVKLLDHGPEWIRLLSFQAPRTVTVMPGPS
jgi:cytochrome P450